MASAVTGEKEATSSELMEFVTAEKDTNINNTLQEVEDDLVTKRKKRRLVLKIDLFILPLIAIVYFLASMGRSDLANASVAGLSKELRLSAQDYSNAANMFLVGYIFFQLPGTLLVRRIGPPTQFAAAMITWGTFTAITLTIKTPAQLLAMRFLIGMAEAFIQGAVFYLSFFYVYTELATRGAIFYSMATLAGAFNGVIAYGITKDLDGSHGWSAWRWIFLIEGILPIFGAFFVFFLLPASPEKMRGFSAEEREMAKERSALSHNNLEEKLNLKAIHKPLLSLTFWLFVIISCCGHFVTSSFSNFLPIIVNGFGYSKVNTQLFTVIVYACAFLGLLVFGFAADRTNKRGLTLATANGTTVLGYALLLGLTSSKGRFAATCITAFGAYAAIVLQISWLTMSVVGYTHRGSALAFTNIFSQMFAICGNQAYTDPPYYRTGNWAALGLTTLSGITALALRFYFKWLNSKKRAEQFEPAANGLRTSTIAQVGTKHPDFFFTP